MAFSFGGFGQQNQQNQQAGQQPSKPTFSFGTPASTTAPASGAGATSTPSFSFGNTSTSSTATQPSTSLFGQAGGQQSQQQQPAGQTGGGSSLFGSLEASTQQQPQQQQQQTGQQSFSFGGFGAKPAGQTSTPAPNAGGGLFGNLGASTANNNQQQQANKPTFSFGGQSSTAAQPASGLSFGASTSQQPTQQQNQSQSGATSSNAPITKSTRFEDLPEPARKMIEEMEIYIQGRAAIYDTLKSEKLGKEIEETSHTLRQLSNEFSALSNHLAHDSRYTADLRNRFEQSLRDAVKAVQIVDAFRAPAVTQPGAPPNQTNKPHPAFLQEFFRRKAEELSRRLATYKSSIEQIQGQLSRSDPDQVKAILPTLRAQHAATLQLASRLSTLESSTTELKDEYRDLWRERTGSVRDPFAERRREVLGADHGVVDAVGTLSIR